MGLLNLTKVIEPFDLSKALQYMKHNGEFIRCKTVDQDFYMYLDKVKRPVVVDGRRQLIETESVLAFNQWGSMAVTINLADLFNESYYLMRFDSDGQPDWSDLRAEREEDV